MQQRNTQTELETLRRQNQELMQAKVKLQNEIANVQDRIERETLAKNDEICERSSSV